MVELKDIPVQELEPPLGRYSGSTKDLVEKSILLSL
jgi:hypothetical protein